MLGINVTCVTLMLDRSIRCCLFALASLTLSTNENIKADVRKAMLGQQVETFKGAELFEGTQYAILALIFMVQAGLAILFILAAVKLGKTGYTMSYQQAIGAYAACTLPVSVACLISFGITTLLSYSILSTLLAFILVFTMFTFSVLLYGKVIEPFMPDTNRRYLYLSFTNTLQYAVLLIIMGRYLASIILPGLSSLI